MKLYRVRRYGLQPSMILIFALSRQEAEERVKKSYGHHWGIEVDNVRMIRGKMFEEIGRYMILKDFKKFIPGWPEKKEVRERCYDCEDNAEKSESVGFNVYCDSCKKCQPVYPVELRKDKLNKKPWSDIVCKECNIVIATISAEVEGDIVLIKAGGISKEVLK